ncbi:MAG: hypothetical protein MJ252_18405, partial [archaeon]|nr:hypothetical protein [archaeon]
MNRNNFSFNDPEDDLDVHLIKEKIEEKYESIKRNQNKKTDGESEDNKSNEKLKNVFSVQTQNLKAAYENNLKASSKYNSPSLYNSIEYNNNGSSIENKAKEIDLVMAAYKILEYNLNLKLGTLEEDAKEPLIYNEFLIKFKDNKTDQIIKKEKEIEEKSSQIRSKIGKFIELEERFKDSGPTHERLLKEKDFMLKSIEESKLKIEKLKKEANEENFDENELVDKNFNFGEGNTN